MKQNAIEIIAESLTSGAVISIAPIPDGIRIFGVFADETMPGGKAYERAHYIGVTNLGTLEPIVITPDLDCLFFRDASNYLETVVIGTEWIGEEEFNRKYGSTGVTG